MDEWFAKNRGLRRMYEETVDGYRAILERLGDHWAAHLDLGAALYRANALDEAETHVRRAIELGHPLPGIAENHLACIALAKGDIETARVHFARGVDLDPQHPLLIRNVQAFTDWLDTGGPARDGKLRLEASHEFQLLERTRQPTLPGPLAKDFTVWAPAEPPKSVPPIRPEEVTPPDRRRRLALLQTPHV
jgi:tetratricopeptide (TPR) repeat protein